LSAGETKKTGHDHAYHLEKKRKGKGKENHTDVQEEGKRSSIFPGKKNFNKRTEKRD